MLNSNLITKQKLLSFIQGINANHGTVNCAHCALRVDEHFFANEHLHLGPVSTESANLYTQYIVKTRKIGDIIEKSTTDSRIRARCTKPQSQELKLVRDWIEGLEYYIDVDELNNSANLLRLTPTTLQEVIDGLSSLRRRKLDGSAYGFISFSDYNQGSAHIINFYVDSYNNVFFIDAQIGKVFDAKTEMSLFQMQYQHFSSVFHYIQSTPRGGFSVKLENIKVKEEPVASPQSAQSIVFHTESIDTLIKKGLLAKARDDFYAAFQYFKKATELYSQDPYPWSLLALCYKAGQGVQENPEYAFTCYHNAVEVGSKNPAVLSALAECYKNGSGTAQNHPAAFFYYRAAAEHGSKEPLIFSILGGYYQSGLNNMPANPQRAFEHYQKALTLAPNDISILKLLGTCHQQGIGTEQNFLKALALFRKAVNLVPQDTQTWMQIEGCSNQFIQFCNTNAIRIVNNLTPHRLPPLNAHAAVVSEPVQPEISNLRILAPVQIPHFQITLDSQQDDKEFGVLMQKGMLYKNVGNINRAIEIFKEASERFPENYDPLSMLGECYHHGTESSDRQLAFLYLREAISKGSQKPSDWSTIAEYYKKGIVTPQNHQIAFSCYQHAVALGENNPITLTALGEYYKTGVGEIPADLLQAYNCYKKAKALDPNNIDMLNFFGEQCLSKKEYFKAIIYFQRILELMPNNTQNWYRLGSCVQRIVELSSSHITTAENILASQPPVQSMPTANIITTTSAPSSMSYLFSAALNNGYTPYSLTIEIRNESSRNHDMELNDIIPSSPEAKNNPRNRAY